MAKPLYVPITSELIHAVATLTAAGVRLNAIMLRTGVSAATVRRIMLEEAWATTLEGKQALFARMMRGEA